MKKVTNIEGSFIYLGWCEENEKDISGLWEKMIFFIFF